MTSDLVPYERQLKDLGLPSAPAVIEVAGGHAKERFFEFFFTTIRNANTRVAYARAAWRFLAWCDRKKLDLAGIRPPHVSAYIETMSKERKPATVKQHRSALCSLFDYLVTGHVAEFNPVRAVRTPRLVMYKKGKTPDISADEVRQLIGSIETDKIKGLRDRAPIGIMLYSFARITTTLSMNV